jgi:hypothetical protein
MKTIGTITLATMVCAALAAGCGGDSGGGGSGTGGSKSGGAGGSGNGAGGGSGGSGGSGGQTGPKGTFSTGLDSGKAVGDLTPADAAKFCAAADTFIKGNPSLTVDLCKLTALLGLIFEDPKTDAEAQMLCKKGYDECVATPATTMCSNTVPKTCRATVGDVEACWSASVAFLDSAVAQIPACDKVTLKDLEPTAGGAQSPTPPAACKPLDTDECSALNIAGSE